MTPIRRIVKFKSSRPVQAAVEPKRILSQQVSVQLNTVEKVAATIEIKARSQRLYAFEEKGNPDARLTPPDPLEDTEDQYKLKTTSDTPFLDIFLGRKFQITTESVATGKGAKDSKATKSNKTSRKKGTAARIDYMLLKLLFRAICPSTVTVPDIVSSNKTSGGMSLKSLMENSATKYTVNRLLRVDKNLEAKKFRVELPIITSDFAQFAHTLGQLISGGKPVVNPETGEKESSLINTKISDDPTDKLRLTLPMVSSITIGKPSFSTKGMDVEELKYLAKANAEIVIHPIHLTPPKAVASGSDLVTTNEPKSGIYACLWIDCSRKEAEYMTKTPFAEIRALDLYSMLLNWAAPASPKQPHRYDSSTSARFSVPLSKMASLLPKDSTDLVRTNEDGICITVDGEFLALPNNVDNTEYYETTYQNYLGDENVAQINSPEDYATGNKKSAAIKSIPILLDWQNCKFSYTDTGGALAVLDLDNSYKATTTHYIRFLRSSCMEAGTKAYSFIRELEIYADLAGLKPEMFGAPPKITEHVNLMANRLGYYNADDASKTPLLVIPYTAKPYKEVASKEEFESDNGIFDPFDNKVHEEKEIPEGGHKTAAANANSQGIMNLASTLLQKMTENPELFYGKRGVISSAGMVALLKIFIKGADFPELISKNIKEKEKYTKQGKDPSYKTDALPLISTDGKGVSPQFHQEEILNLLRDLPENAAIPAAAGSGKCLTNEHVVATDRGLLTLGEIYEKSGDPIGNTGFRVLSGLKVISSKGRVPADKSYSTKGKTVRVNLSDGSYVEGLPEHRMWATTDGISFDYVRLDKLTSSHSLEKRIGLGLFGSLVKLPKLELPEFISASTRKSSKNIKIPTTMTESLASLLGYIVSEGVVSLDPDRVEVINTDREVISNIENSLTTIFGAESYSKVVHNPRKPGNLPLTLIRVRSTAKTFIQQLVRAGHSDDRNIPVCIRRAPKNIQLAFLRSLFEGDGSVYVKSGGKNDKGYANSWIVEYTTISNDLCVQLKAVLENLDIPCTVRTRKPYVSAQGNNGVPKMKRAHTLMVNYRHFDKFRQIGFDCTRKQDLFAQACTDADDAKNNLTNKNTDSQGIFNRFYFTGSRSIITQVVNTILESKDYTRKASSHGLTLIQYTTQVFEELGLSKDSNRGFVHSEYTDKLSRHAVNQIHKFISPNIHLVPLQLRIKYNALVVSFSKSWVQPASTERYTTSKRVYDISVPGPHDYVVNSMLSHNTMQAILDILVQIDKGDTGPFVIACPAELVSDYTKEISYATAGKLNPICITTDVWNRHQIEVRDGLRNIIRKAPRNSVLVVAYRTLSLKAYEVVYGTEKVTIYPVLELIRSFRPTYGFFDECHKLKNPNGLQHKAAARLIAGLKTKRIASGTMVANTLVDIAAQVKLIDPTIFGTQGQFAEKYMTMVNGKLAPKPGAEQAAKNLIFSNMVIAGADRKKWAYKLPRAHREFVAVRLTPLQQVTHDYLLKTAFEEMSGDSDLGDNATGEISETGQALKDSEDKYQNSIAKAVTEANENLSSGLAVLHENAKFQGGINSGRDVKQVITDAAKEASKNDYSVDALDAADAIDKDDDEDDDEDSKSGDLELSGYLTQLEGFINDPSTYEELMWRVSELTDVPFTNLDLYSPKVAACIERIKGHLDKNIPGKIIVFCNYNNTREAIIRALPPEIRSQTINYLASQKLSMRQQFETDPKMKVMIGIEKSLSTGFNFQNASRLVRIETVWSPSDVEQGDSRINRPNVKAKEVREAIYYDTIVADDTVDITKSSYLVAKLVSQIKFDQTEAVSMEDRVAVSKQGTANPFMLLDNPPPFRLSPKNIMENSSIQHMSTTYLSVLNKTNNLLRRSYAQYALDHKNELFENPELIEEDKVNVHLTRFPLTLIQKTAAIKEKPAPADCALMYRIPYAAGMNIYGSDALGLIPYRQWLEFKKFDLFVNNQGYSLLFSAPDGVTRGSPEYKSSISKHTKQIGDLEKEFVKLHQPVVHTAFGDGVCKNSSGVNLWVYTDEGTKLLVPKSTCFIVNRAYTNTEDIRTSLLERAKLRIQDAVVKDLGAVPKKQLINEEDTKSKKIPAVSPVAPTAPVKELPGPAVDDKLALSVLTVNGFPYIRVDDTLLGKNATTGKLIVKPTATKLMEEYNFSNFGGSTTSIASLFLIDTPTGKDLLDIITLWEKNGFRVALPLRSKLLGLTKHTAGGSDLVAKLEAMQIPMLTKETVQTLRNVKDRKNAEGAMLISPFPYVINGVTLGIVLASASNNVRAIETFKASKLASKLKGSVLSGYGLRSAPTLAVTDLEETLQELASDGLIGENTVSRLVKRLNSFETRDSEGLFTFSYTSGVELETPKTPATKLAAPQNKPAAPQNKPAESPKPKLAPANKIHIAPVVRIVNNIPAIAVAVANKNELSILESIGFREDLRAKRVRVSTMREISKVVTTLMNTPGVAIPPANLSALLSVFDTWKKHRDIEDLEKLVPKIHTQLQIERQVHTKPVDPTRDSEGKPYDRGTKFIFLTPVVTDTTVSLSVPISHIDSMKLFTEVVVPNVIEKKLYTSQENVYSYYAKNKQDLGNKFAELLDVADLENIKDLTDELSSLRITPDQQ